MGAWNQNTSTSLSNSNLYNSNTIVMIGDSYTALHKGGAAPGITTPATGYFNWANTKMKKKFLILNNAGVAGETTTQILARFNSSAMALNPGWIMLQGGINDINAGASVSSIVSNLIAMCNTAIANGIKVILTTIPVIVAWSGNRTKLNACHDLNSQLKQYARTKNNIILIDWNPLVIDQSTGLVNSIYTYDNTHFSVLGNAIVGDYIASILDQFISYFDTLPSTNDDVYTNNSSIYTNLCPNPMLTGNSSGLPSTGGWNPNVTLSTGGNGVVNTDYQVSKVSALDATNGKYRGFDWQQLKALTGTGNEKRFAFRPGTSQTVGWSVGDWLYAECEYESDADWTACSRLHFSLQTLGVVYQSYDLFINGTTNGSHPGSTTPQYILKSGVFRTYPIQIQTGVTSVYPEFNFYAVAGTIRVGRFAVRKATPVTINGVSTFLY